MSVNNKNEFELPCKQVKTKLDEIWTELQTNLPAISFNDDDDDDDDGADADQIDKDEDDLQNEVQKDTDFNLIYNENADYDKKLNTDFIEDYDENSLNTISGQQQRPYFSWLTSNDKELDNYLNKHDESIIENKLSPSLSSSAASMSLINDIYLDDPTSNINLKLKSLAKMKNNATTANTAADSAAKITKNIFDSTNCKLSMDIFDSINIDEILETVKKNKNTKKTETSKSYFKLNETTGSSNNTNNNENNNNSISLQTRLISDEIVLMKLAEMSMSISNDNDLNHLDLKTGAISDANSSTNSLHSLANNRNLSSPKINRNLLSSVKTSSPQPSSLSLNEVTIKNSSKDQNDDVNNQESVEEKIKKDLDKFLKEHNLKDGNLIATRRIDLRVNNQQHQQQQQTSTKTHRADRTLRPFHLMLENLQLNANDESSFIESTIQKGLKFLNDNNNNQSESDSSSSDDDSDEESNDDSLWIERYRKHKQQNLANKF